MNYYESGISNSPHSQLQHLLSINDLNRQQLYQIMDQANTWINPAGELIYPAPILKNKTVVNLLFENSTRTRSSFELAAKRLGAVVLNFNAKISSVQKGETLFDTVDNLSAMGTDLFIIRHPEEQAPGRVAAHLGTRARVINAGDGCNEHPTQALLDMYTIRRYKTNFNQLRVAIIGDIRHSRVAHSNLNALIALGVPDIRLVGPSEWLPPEASPQVSLHHDIVSGIQEADVVMVLRIQRERMGIENAPDSLDYFKRFGLTAERLKLAHPDAIVMHPGPINREVEVASEVVDGKQSVILRQVTFGVAVRMAIMDMLFH